MEDPGGGVRDDLIADGKDIVMVGADAVKLYPSMTHVKTAEAVYRAALTTHITWESFTWQEQAKYLAVCLNEDE